MALSDYKDINELKMANTILHLSLNHTGNDDLQSRIVYNTFEANKMGDKAALQKTPSEKTTVMGWHAGQFARAFRENYSNLNWLKVYEAFADLADGLDPGIELDPKAYTTLL